jgi:hypothetical protein
MQQRTHEFLKMKLTKVDAKARNPINIVTHTTFMKIEDYLAGDFPGEVKRGDVGTESSWLEFCNLLVRGNKVHAVDASYAADGQEGCMIDLRPGKYHVQVKAMAYGNDVRMSRLRVIWPGSEPTAGPEIGQTGTDTGNVGVYDFDIFAKAWGNDNNASWDKISPAIESADMHGIAVLDDATGAIMPFVRSGFGDGTFPVNELLQNGSRVGFEICFMSAGEPYPF